MGITNLGIAAPEVKMAKDLLSGRKVSGCQDLFVCEGLWAVDKLITQQLAVKYFFFCPDMVKSVEEQALVDKMCDYASAAFQISYKACGKISDRDGADGFFIVAQMPVYRLEDLEDQLTDNMVIMVLDGQEQPGNIGAILRSLDCAGGAFAVMTNKRVRLTHPRLIRSSLGAAFMMPVAEAPMDKLTAWLAKHDFKAILTDLTATRSYRELDYQGRIAIVAGNEFKGISPEWRNLDIAEPIIIPMLGSCESLNVGFASTLVAYEAGLRQKGL